MKTTQDPVGDEERFPLRSSHLEALKGAVLLHGAKHVAAAVGTSATHIDYYVEGGLPSVDDRQRIIAYLLRSGAVKPAPGDLPFDPDGSEDPKAVRAWLRRFGPGADRR